MSQDQIAAIDKNIQEAKVLIELGKSLDRLRLNKDFKTVIDQGYFKDEPVRLVSLLADPGSQRPEQQQDIRRQMDAISHLQAYFRLLDWKHERSVGDLEASEVTRESILLGEDE